MKERLRSIAWAVSRTVSGRGLAPLPFGPVARVCGPEWPVAAVIAVYLLVFGRPIGDAIKYLVYGDAVVRAPAGDWLPHLIDTALAIVSTAAAVLIGLYVARSLGAGPRQVGLGRPPRRRDWAVEYAIGAGMLIVTVLSFTTGVALFGPQGYPLPADMPAPWAVSFVVSGVLAGPREEILLVAVLVTVMRRTGCGWGWVFALGIGLRIAFHIYYGWNTVALTLWAATAITVYAVTGRIWGLIIGHSMFNLSNSIGVLVGPPWNLLPALLSVSIIVAGVAVFSVLRNQTLRPPQSSSQQEKRALQPGR